MMSEPTGRGRGRAWNSKPQNRLKKSAKVPRVVPGISDPFRSEPSGSGDGSGPSGGRTERVQRAVMQETSVVPSLVQAGGDLPKVGGISGNNDGNGDGNGNGKPVGRGGLRGHRHQFTEILKTRPDMCLTKKGTSGKQVVLHCNYFKVDTLRDWVIYQYRVDFSVEEDNIHQKRAWLREHVGRIGQAYIFDGTLLYSARRLLEDKERLSLTSIREADRLPILIEIRLVKKVAFGDSVYLQVFNILLRRCLSHLKLQLVQRNYFDPNAAIKIPEFNLELWPGYVTAIRQNECDILMCAEITHKVMRKDTARDVLMECRNQSDDYKLLFQQAMIGQVVLTDYNNKTYTIDDVDFSINPTSTFKLRNNEDISFVEYYANRYKIRIADLKQPLLISRSNQKYGGDGVRKHCLLVPELCRMTGLDGKMLENTRLKRVLSEHTRLSPPERMKRLLDFNERLLDNSKIVDEFNHWELRLNRALIKVPARELPPETIVGGEGRKYSAGMSTDWTREVRSRPMLKNGNVKEWAVIYPSFLARDVSVFLENLRKAALGMNFSLPAPRLCETANDKPPYLMEAVEDLMGLSRIDLLMFVVTNFRCDRYNSIKRKCYVDRGVQSQVILAKNLVSKGLSVATKVAIQLNCKLGGAPWSVDLPLQSFMVVGFDVYHCAGNKNKSYGAVVASMNSAMTSWFSVVSPHTNGVELSDALSANIGKALLKFREINGTLPSKIFVYRDGVGDGQLNYVFEHEVQLLKKKLTDLYGGENWKMGYIVVSKRINTRLFKSEGNPSAGTVVDDVITLPERYDFFLVSQNVNVGTVSPTSYNVISDNLGLTPDQIQRWTYKMTHLYYNWSGTVRVPAACQYAHKLAYLVGQSLHVLPNPRLNSTLYYL